MGEREIEYTTPIYETKKVGEEKKTEVVKTCDGCGEPLVTYTEIDKDWKPTGRVSPVKIFSGYRTEMHGSIECSLCHKRYCSPYIGYHEKVYDDCDDFVGDLILCNRCFENPGEKIVKVMSLIKERGSLVRELEDKSEELACKYREME